VAGNFLDLRYSVTCSGETLAQAKGRLLTVRDRHDIEVMAQPELFVVFALVVLQLDRRDEKRRASDDDN
jgi:uncharacterized protein YxjI